MSSESAPSAAPRFWGLRLALPAVILATLLGVVCELHYRPLRKFKISDWFYAHQDLKAALYSLALFALIATPLLRLPARWIPAIEGFVRRRGRAICVVAAGLVAAGAFGGWWWVYQQYPLSLDEFWAVFDARIFRHGQLMAPIAPPWRPYARALSPFWRLETPGDQFWASTYLPINAAFRALFDRLGSQALAGPFWAALSILLTYDLARRFWPKRPDAAFVATLLLATSAQLIVTAMSPYAMTAHLALNLTWLWLFLRKSRWAQVAAALVAFCATGLHQIVFHPLFAAPFVLQLWWERRWRKAAFHSVAYGCIGLFWLSYWRLMLGSQGFSPLAAAAAVAHGASANAVAASFKLSGLPYMAENLFRFIVWQSPLTVPLALVGGVAAVRGLRGPLPPLAAGIILTIILLIAITPFQGHGWGYRYVHGFLGSVALLAAAGWVRLTEGRWASAAPRAWATFAASMVFALAVWIPMRLGQVAAFTTPYARAYRAIRQSPADVVIVDPRGLWYGDDLVRNDPFLGPGPKVMKRTLLKNPQLQALCARYKVALFDRADGAAFGIIASSRTMSQVKALPPPPCGVHIERPSA